MKSEAPMTDITIVQLRADEEKLRAAIQAAQLVPNHDLEAYEALARLATTAIEALSDSRSAASTPLQGDAGEPTEPKLICPQCGIDRYKEACSKHPCGFVASGNCATQPSEPAAIPAGQGQIQCPVCKGSGLWDYSGFGDEDTCEECQGKGRVPAHPAESTTLKGKSSHG